MKLLALSDLHVGFPENRRAVLSMRSRPDDWLILAGDIGETTSQLEWVLETLAPRFRQLIWVPGNHDLWTRPADPGLRGVAKYEKLVEICRARGVLTPEDPYPRFPDPLDSTRHYRIAPLFLLYDYSFRPDHVPEDQAVAWALEDDVLCADEVLLDPHPFASRVAWCHERCRITEARLTELREQDAAPVVLINHFPLRRDVAKTPAIPRFSIWCGTRRSELYHRRFGAEAVVSGHLHLRSTTLIDGVRFEEVSVGYPRRQWRPEAGMDGLVRQILPYPS